MPFFSQDRINPAALRSRGQTTLPVRGLRCAAFLLLVMLCGARSARSMDLLSSPEPQQTSSQQPATQPQTPPPPRGKVLFERHDPPVTDTPVTDQPDAAPATPSEPATQPNPTGKPGISSSTKRSRTTLHRHEEQPAATEATAPDAARTAAVSSSAADDNAGAALATAVTEADRQAAREVSAAERRSIAVAASDLDMHLNAHTGETEVRAQLTVRNSGDMPLLHLPLRTSGALRWESARIAGAATSMTLEQHHLPDDLDHTGVSNELVLTLPQPLAAGGTVRLDLYYGGTLAAGAQRLLALGAPASRAAQTDWDTVTDTFTGLRGLGQVLWYPVAGEAALLRDGNAVPDAVEESRTRDAASSFRLRLTLQYEGSRPDAAFFCGERQPLKPLVAGSDATNDTGAVTAEWVRSPLGRHTPSLFVAGGAPAGTGTIRVMSTDAAASAAVNEAVLRVVPMLSEWLGAAPERPLQVLDLPIPGAAAFADGPLLVIPLSSAAVQAAFASSLVQPLATAWLPDGISAPWLREGLPAFLQAVWAERTQGRAAALANLAATDASLRARSQPVPSAISSSQEHVAPSASLATCTDAECARARAAYVFEMLRSMLGDAALQQAVSGWRVQAESAHRTAAQETSAMEKLLQQTAGARDLGWFFRSWIDAGRSLPDLTIVTVAPRRVERSAPTNYLPQARSPVAGPIGAEPVPQVEERRTSPQGTASSSGGAAPPPGSWLVAVEVQNNGGTDAEVPVTVRNGSLTNTLPLRVAAGSRATIRVPFEAEPEEVLVNDGSVPEAQTTQHRRSIRNLPPLR